MEERKEELIGYLLDCKHLGVSIWEYNTKGNLTQQTPSGGFPTPKLHSKHCYIIVNFTLLTSPGRLSHPSYTFYFWIGSLCTNYIRIFTTFMSRVSPQPPDTEEGDEGKEAQMLRGGIRKIKLEYQYAESKDLMALFRIDINKRGVYQLHSYFIYQYPHFDELGEINQRIYLITQDEVTDGDICARAYQLDYFPPQFNSQQICIAFNGTFPINVQPIIEQINILIGSKTTLFIKSFFEHIMTPITQTYRKAKVKNYEQADNEIPPVFDQYMSDIADYFMQGMWKDEYKSIVFFDDFMDLSYKIVDWSMVQSRQQVIQKRFTKAEFQIAEEKSNIEMEELHVFRVFFTDIKDSLTHKRDEALQANPGFMTRRTTTIGRSQSILISSLDNPLLEKTESDMKDYNIYFKEMIAFKLDMLDCKNIYIFNTKGIIYGWIGGALKNWISKYSLSIIKQFVNKCRKFLINYSPPFLLGERDNFPLRIEIIFQGMEPPELKSLFSSWPDRSNREFIMGGDSKALLKKQGIGTHIQEFEDISIRHRIKVNVSEKVKTQYLSQALIFSTKTNSLLRQSKLLQLRDIGKGGQMEEIVSLSDNKMGIYNLSLKTQIEGHEVHVYEILGESFIQRPVAHRFIFDSTRNYIITSSCDIKRDAFSQHSIYIWRGAYGNLSWKNAFNLLKRTIFEREESASASSQETIFRRSTTLAPGAKKKIGKKEVAPLTPQTHLGLRREDEESFALRNLQPLKNQDSCKVLLRSIITQDTEPLHFLNLCDGNMVITTKDSEQSVFGNQGTNNPMLFNISGEPGVNQKAREVPCIVSSLDSMSTLIMLTMENSYLWIGKQYMRMNIKKINISQHKHFISESLLKCLLDIYREQTDIRTESLMNLSIVIEGAESDDFLLELQSEIESREKEKELKTWRKGLLKYTPREPRLFYLSGKDEIPVMYGEGGGIHTLDNLGEGDKGDGVSWRLFHEVRRHEGRGNILNDYALMLVDVNSEIFVWIGGKVSETQVLFALPLAMNFVTHLFPNKYALIPITQIFSGYEPNFFKIMFPRKVNTNFSENIPPISIF